MEIPSVTGFGGGSKHRATPLEYSNNFCLETLRLTEVEGPHAMLIMTYLGLLELMSIGCDMNGFVGRLVKLNRPSINATNSNGWPLASPRQSNSAREGGHGNGSLTTKNTVAP